MSAEALAALSAYTWPGNVRELAHAIERAALVCDADEIAPEHLSPEILGGPGPTRATGPAGVSAPEPDELAADGLGYQEARRQFEVRYFTRLLETHGGNVQRAAEAAGLHRTTLYEKLAKMGLTPKG
jgi:DNA-binding NtrC family response regulator